MGNRAGFPKITYTADTVKIFDKFAAQIWEMAVEDAEDMGYKNEDTTSEVSSDAWAVRAAAMIAEFGRSDMLDSFLRFTPS